MNIPKEIIELAIEGRWKDAESFEMPVFDYGTYVLILKTGAKLHLFPEAIVLDSTFWQALSKSLGWDIHAAYVTDPDDGSMGIKNVQVWKLNAFRLYDLILTNQSTDAFFADLLANRN